MEVPLCWCLLPTLTPSDPGIDMVTAVQQQLGLRLEKGKGWSM